ncbi:MAG: hypothetical protein U5N86_06505 [Planctomycetota bacterium]|nr:hypothetical protein [Planctomycetota bacterium]
MLGCGRNAIRFIPPLCITEPQVHSVLEILDGVLSKA